MLGFLKKLFGFDKETMKDAGVQIEQQAPYKVEVDHSKGNADYHDAPDWLRDGDPKTTGPASVEVVKIEEVAPVVVAEQKPAAMTAKKKPRGPKKPQGQKPAAKPAAKAQPAKQPARRGRKPKAN